MNLKKRCWNKTIIIPFEQSLVVIKRGGFQKTFSYKSTLNKGFIAGTPYFQWNQLRKHL